MYEFVEWGGVKIEFVPYSEHTGGRIWIGDIRIADVYERKTKGDLFVPESVKYECHIGIFQKHQPPGKWLEHIEKPYFTKNTIKEILEQLIIKLENYDTVSNRNQ